MCNTKPASKWSHSSFTLLRCSPSHTFVPEHSGFCLLTLNLSFYRDNQELYCLFPVVLLFSAGLQTQKLYSAASERTDQTGLFLLRTLKPQTES